MANSSAVLVMTLLSSCHPDSLPWSVPIYLCAWSLCPPPWLPFSSHPQPLPCWPLSFLQALPATPLPISTVADVLDIEWRRTDITWYPCCHITAFPCCEKACQNPVPPKANWELSPAGNSWQIQLADLEIFLTEARKLRLSILAIVITLNQICFSIWLMIKANPLKKLIHTYKKTQPKTLFPDGLNNLELWRSFISS